MNVLIIEDDPRLAERTAAGLATEGITAEICGLSFEGEDRAATEPFDAIILDLGLPDRDGIEVCRNLRRRGVETAILMLSGRTDTDEKIRGLNAGADDYMTKPASLGELIARLRALTRRTDAHEARSLRVHDLDLDIDHRVAHRQGRRISLSNKEFGLLYYLMQNAEKVLSRTLIVEKVWDMNYEPNSNVIDVYISALRKKVDRGFDEPLIHTVIGSGYRFGADADPFSVPERDTEHATEPRPDPAGTTRPFP